MSVLETYYGQSAIQNIDITARPPISNFIIARIVSINTQTATINCVGEGTQQGIQWQNVPVLNTVYSQKEGRNWLPLVDPSKQVTDDLIAKPTGTRDAYAMLCFVEGNSSIPICVGFISPGLNELTFNEAGSRIDRHYSNVYERLTATGKYEMVFPDKTYFLVTDADGLDIPDDLEAKYAYNVTNPWNIPFDRERKIVFGTSIGNTLSLSNNGLSVTTKSNDQDSAFQTTIFDSYGIRTSGTVYFNGVSLSDVTQSQINNSISSVFNNGTLPSLSGSTSPPVNLNVPGTSITDGSLPLSKLDTTVATYAQLLSTSATIYTSINTLQTNTAANLATATNSLQTNINTVSTNLSTHIADTTIHLQLGTSHTTAAYGDHTHDALNTNGSVTYASTILSVSSTSNVVGTTSTVARGDHAHGLNIVSLSATPGNITIGATAGTGSSTTAFARADHIHGTPSTWTPATHTHAGLSNTSTSINLNSDGTMDLTGSSINLTGTLNINGTSLQNIIRANQTDQSYLLFATTNDNTNMTYLTTSGGTYATSILSGTNHVVVSSNQVWAFVVDVVANAQSGTSGGRWTINGLLKKGNTIASTQFIGTPMATTVSVDSAFAGAAVYVNIENSAFGSLVVSVIGLASTSITWGAVVTIKGAYNNASSTAYSSYPIQSVPPVSASTSYDFTTYMLQTSTTSNEIATMTMDGLTASSANMPILANNTAWFVKMTIIANAAGISAGAFIISGIYRRALGPSTITFVGPLTYEQLTDTALDNANVSVDTNTSLGAVSITVLGVTNTAIKWLSIIEATEIS